MTKNTDTWKKFYAEAHERHNLFPSETLVRMMKGSSYLTKMDKDYDGRSILEVGFGSGNNLALFSSLGLNLAGVEVDQDICDAVVKKFNAIGLNVDARKGDNRNIPFEDNSFDFLVSWATVHYESDIKNYEAALREFRRVLKPGGWVLLETVAPNHSIFRDSQIEGPFIHRIMREDDIRCGQTFLCLEDEKYVKHYYSKVFNDVVVGTTDLCLFNERINTFLVAGRK